MLEMEATSTTGEDTILDETAVSELAEKLHGDLIRPTDEGYHEARGVHNGMIDKRPALIARCTGVADVIDAVNFGRENQLLVSVRGGGGNFGIVTSFEYRLHPVGPKVMFAAVMYPVERARQLLPVWRCFMAEAPNAVSAEALFWTIPAVEAFPEETHHRDVLIIAALYSDDWREGKKVLQPLRELAEPVLDLSGVFPYTQVQTMFDPFFPEGEFQYYWKSLRLDRLDDEVIDAIIEHAATRPSPRTIMPIWHHGGAMSRVGPQETAFGDRSAPYLLSLDSTWEDPADTEENIAWTRAVWEDMQRFSTHGSYLNFPGMGEEGEDLVRAAYGANYERLAALKQKYDPTNLFHMNQNIEPDGR